MKQYHVYELFDQTGQIVYVGMSSNPKSRFRQHINTKPGYGNGKFYGQQDLDWRIHSTYDTRKTARLAEGARKLELGMEWTERIWQSTGGKVGGRKNVESGHVSIAGKVGGKIASSIIRTCPHCDKQTKGIAYFKYHGDRCKLKP